MPNMDPIFECKNCTKCKVCSKAVAANHHAIECNICLKGVHIKCIKPDKKDYNTFQTNEHMHFYCIKCLAEPLPFLDLNNKQFDLTAKGIDIPEEVNIDEIFLNETPLNMIRKINKAIDRFDLSDDKTDIEEEIHPINCKYYSTDQFNEQKFNYIKHFSILHLCIHSLEFHIEELRIALELIHLKFDLICLTESKIRKNTEPKIDITIANYQEPIGTPTEASKGGGGYSSMLRKAFISNQEKI